MYTSKMMIVMRRDLKMRKGKIAAQAGHACVTAILKALQRDGLLSCIHIEENGAITLPEDLPETPLTAWFTRGEAKICVYVDSEEELLALDREAKEPTQNHASSGFSEECVVSFFSFISSDSAARPRRFPHTVCSLCKNTPSNRY